MKKLMLATTALAALITAPALGADLRMATKAPAAVVAAPVMDWTGFYIGVHGGYAWGDADYNFNTAGHYNFVAGDRFSHSIDGGMVGGHVGYNWQWSPNVLFGIEGSGSWTDIRRTAVSPFFPATDTFRTRVNAIGTVTPRLGWTFNNMLLYVKGGVAIADIDTRTQDAVDFVSRSDTKVGWTVGGGVEWMMAPNWIFGIEGNYYEFDRLNVNQNVISLATGATLAPATNHNVDVNVGSVLARVTYKFGGYGGPVVARY